eukprot:TRINITY_DN5753_c0_g1_i20.p2 TRINITY_DN5753_c0_g1~~TRINITY_DN5753_c0_g1_i20.p2  ORF type:complete len:131 (+),score=14.92 TRINITY_DN5753_c0_g1_i20:894-1286(+)
MNLSNEIKSLQREISLNCSKLSFALEILFLVLKIQTKLDSLTYDTIRSALAIEQMYILFKVVEMRIGRMLPMLPLWCRCTQSLVKTKVRDIKTVGGIIIPREIYDNSKFKKSISVICDRVLKGIRVTKES